MEKDKGCTCALRLDKCSSPPGLDEKVIHYQITPTNQPTFILPQLQAKNNIAAFVLQREVFIHFDEDSRPREDKIIHTRSRSHEEKIVHNEATKVAKTDPLIF
jgi:hypothetical protein